MTNHFSHGVIAIVFCVFSFSAIALDKNGKFAIKGVGNVSCEQFVKTITEDDPQKFLFAGWLNGYLTAHNQHLKDTFDITSWEDVETLGTYLKSHCSKNPNLSFFQATTQLLNEMYEQRIVEFIGAENIASGTQSLKTYVQVITRVQQALAVSGFYKGKIDGIMSPQVKEALSEYRKDKKIAASEYLDQITLHTLLRK